MLSTEGFSSMLAVGTEIILKRWDLMQGWESPPGQAMGVHTQDEAVPPAATLQLQFQEREEGDSCPSDKKHLRDLQGQEAEIWNSLG